ncbi:MAG TPA: condensation domain-containing protein, partial [Ktedonobacteraceae bacterium]|nr:condensation domain-containing protein [Ktedonobacteraceae bacterium]
LEELEALPESERPPLSLRWIMPTGEALPTQLCQRWLQHYPYIPVLNTYGSTECSDDVAHMAFRTEDSLVDLPATAPIGSVVGNTQIYLLDEHLSPVPIGVAGELYIGGTGLTRGYLGRPDLTAERFVPNPFNGEPGTRLYRMGDRARYRADGTLEYLGRVDHLVKLRGFRIELGEIESVLRSYPAVSEAAAMVREDTPGSKRLVAYLMAKPEETLEIPAIRSYLKQQLPDYMVPATFVLLPEMPLLENGKLNRRALPVPDQGRADLAASYVAPQTETEMRLAEVWCQVLGLKQVGIHDNFFDAGGDSLLGIRMIALAHKVGVHLTPKLLLQYQTISELLEVSLDAPLAVAEQGLVVGSFPLIPMQGWALRYWPWKNPHRWNFAYLFQVPNPLDRDVLSQTVYYLMRHHDGLRMGFRQVDGDWEAYLPEPGEEVPLTWIDLSDLAEAEQVAAIEERADALQGSLNLFTGQAFRVAYFDLGPRRPGRFLILLHLLIADAFSLRIMLHDIQVGYAQLSRGGSLQLPDKTTSVKQWAETLNTYIASPEMKQEIDNYWKALPWEQASPLPVDYPERRGTATTDSIRKVFQSLSSEETTALLSVITQETTILDVLLTALLLAFHPMLGERPLPVGVRELGRHTEFDDIEPPANTVGRLSFDRQLLLNIGKDGDLVQALDTIKEQLENAPQRAIGHNLLAYMSRDPEVLEAMQRIPPPEILLNHTGQMQQAFSLPQDLALFGAMAAENPGPTRDPGELLDFPIFLFSTIRDTFAVLCEYSSTLYEHATVEALIQRYMDAIRAIVLYLQSTPSA